MNVKALISCAVAVILCGCFLGYRSEADTKALRVRRGTFASDVVITGELRAARGEELAVPRLPQWQTSIKWIAPDGIETKKGDRIVELDNSTFSTNLDAKRQAVAQAEQQLQQKEAEWKADTLDKQLDVAATCRSAAESANRFIQVLGATRREASTAAPTPPPVGR